MVIILVEEDELDCYDWFRFSVSSSLCVFVFWLGQVSRLGQLLVFCFYCVDSFLYIARVLKVMSDRNEAFGFPWGLSCNFVAG
jgi:hypothetical protein